MKKSYHHINIDQIINNNISGSNDILSELIDQLNLKLKPKLLKNFRILEELLYISDIMLEKHGDFAVLVHFLNELHLKLEEIKSKKVGEDTYNTEIQRFIIKYKEEYSNTNDNIALQASDNLSVQSSTILVHSNSSAVLSLFKKFVQRGKEIEVIQTRSEPAMEGIIQGEKIRSMGLKVEVMPDNEIDKVTPEIDMAIVGSDRIHPGYFVNKHGTNTIAFACKKYKKPFIVLSERRKIWSDHSLFKTINDKHSLYDQTSLTNVTFFALDDGFYSPEQMVHLFSEIRLSDYMNNRSHNDK